MDKLNVILIALLLSSLMFNFVLAYKIDTIKQEVINNCNLEIERLCGTPIVQKKTYYVNVDDIKENMSDINVE